MNTLMALNHELKEIEVYEFFYIKKMGWAFAWYDTADAKKEDCSTYGLFPEDFCPTEYNCEKHLKDYLQGKEWEWSRHGGIPIERFFFWLEQNKIQPKRIN